MCIKISFEDIFLINVLMYKVNLLYGWKRISEYNVPYLIRKINNDDEVMLVSTKIAETHLLSKYLNCLNPEIYYTCTSVESCFMTDDDSKKFDVINKMCSNVYGNDKFIAGKDYMVSLDDVEEFYKFIEECYNKLTRNITHGDDIRCGFIMIDNQDIVPYCINGGQKYIPLFYFEVDSEILNDQTVILERWDMAYVKFCFKVQGITNEFPSDYCPMISLDIIKNYLPPETHFNDYWPPDSDIPNNLLYHNFANNSIPIIWFKLPPEVVFPKIIFPKTSPITEPVITSNMTMMTNDYQNGWPANQMVYNIY